MYVTIILFAYLIQDIGVDGRPDHKTAPFSGYKGNALCILHGSRSLRGHDSRGLGSPWRASVWRARFRSLSTVHAAWRARFRSLSTAHAVWRALGARCTQFYTMLHANEVRYTQLGGPLARAARSFTPCFTQMRYGTRSFLPDPKEGPPHLPARLMLHAVFGASESACTILQLRVAWGKTACIVPQLRVAWGKTACIVPQLRVAWGRNCVHRAPFSGPR